MADASDVAATKLLRKEFTKALIDVTYADLRVMHGVAYIRGTVALQRASEASDIRSEVERVGRILRQRREFKDVVIDCRYKV
jgi:hypothetical protein